MRSRVGPVGSGVGTVAKVRLEVVVLDVYEAGALSCQARQAVVPAG
ncbi:hypothetical protein [Nocardia otitidiscaviarum]|nr:hypothetical protein [Nocardia otitidiscaviarum]MBF6181221.1 hypothetical protein [Nocardia otitidiscaviarum]